AAGVGGAMGGDGGMGGEKQKQHRHESKPYPASPEQAHEPPAAVAAGISKQERGRPGQQITDDHFAERASGQSAFEPDLNRIGVEDRGVDQEQRHQHELDEGGDGAGSKLRLLLADPVHEVLRRECEPADLSHEAERDRPDVLVPFEGQVKSEKEVQRLEEDGKAAAEQASPDQRKQSGEPETVIEQPEGLVALACASVSRESDRQDQGTKEQREEEPHLPLEAEQKGDCGDA